VRQHTTTPLAVGEIFNTIWDARDLIQNQLIDYIRATIVGAGGVTHLRRLADLAALYQVRTGCHGATDLSVTMGAALHFDTWVPNFGIQEYMRHTEETDAVFPHDYTFADGFLLCGETPGHGVDIDEDLAAKYPTSRPTCPSPALRTARCGTGETHADTAAMMRSGRAEKCASANPERPMTINWRAVRVRILLLVMVGTVINYLARNSLGVLAPQLKLELSISTQQLHRRRFPDRLHGDAAGRGDGYRPIGLTAGFALFAIAWSLANMAHAFARGWFSLAVFRGCWAWRKRRRSRRG
jgi:hypothetical protein